MLEALLIEEADGVILNTATKKKVGGGGEKEDDDDEEDLVFSLIPMVRSRSQAGNRRVAPTCVATCEAEVEKKLPNGDLYIGSFYGGVPHGSGKYFWKDRCTYEGEWKRGKASGKGKFSWPSGATFVGEFRSGRMEGFGTFVGVAGDTYRGAWVADRKHGYGQKRYANGDFYEGTWRRNLQDGRGRYVWSNGNQYIGEWKNGVISGKGILIWANGDKYEGQWENGIPKGNCVFTWADGSSCAGNWNEEKGNILKIQPQEPNSGGDNSLKGIDKNELIATARKRSSVEGGRGSLGAERVFPKICIWQSDGEAGDITCDIIDNVQASMIYGEGFWKIRRNPYYFNDEVKKPGESISKGHKSYDWMLNLQLGIRYSVGRHASILRELKPSDFDPKEKFWTRFPPEGSKITPPHQSLEFRWKDYCPVVFRHLRELFQVDPADYMLAICGNDAFREISSPGKSGSVFYLTQDDRFMIKTVKKSEVKVLIKMLSRYHRHVCQYENSLVTRFYGVHCIKPVGGQKTRFIIMGNLFYSDYRIHRRFDLKGSSHGRSAEKSEVEIDEYTTLKDLDLNFVFRLEGNRFQEFVEQIDRDCEFLEAERIMDYSLLVGIHFRDNDMGENIGLSPFILRSGNRKKDSYQQEKFMRGCRFLEAELQDMDRKLAGRKPLIRLGANMPARAEKMARRSDFDLYTLGRVNSMMTSSCNREIYEVVLYFGIIDILQDYDITKRIEHAYKSFQANPSSISAVDPKLYSKRFRDFISGIFIEDR